MHSSSNLKVKPMRIGQLTLVQKQVLGIGAEFREHSFLYLRHAAWVYVDDFFFLFPKSTAHIQFALAIILLRIIGAPLSWKKLEFDSRIEWNGWSIQPALMTAKLPNFKLQKITTLVNELCQTPCRKNLEQVIGIVLWGTSLVHHIRFLLTTLYRDLCAIPATNYSVQPTQWTALLSILNDDAFISQQNSLQLPVGGRIVEFKHKSISPKAQLPIDIPIERHAWVRIRDPTSDKKTVNRIQTHSILDQHFSFTSSFFNPIESIMPSHYQSRSQCICYG